ncbi:60S ribosomal protein L7ae/L30e, putative [Plasmodium berghei]|uniref:60S ribosomal protein L7ae/L30e, putative n=2 Tax=Plasmodium berghei TaxID=5821 RepID=A0A509AGB1_PLABA|nr:60S ribosomal protein L7ae/L30e, putative [Plasmodium berghei ANKA]CXI27399.1 60S ribosomal protein L7ae/L30e, putative [Plasmodium berghei]SCM20572.1 60S ribosomal protein L7ae/L30e, putative [Plasmodium berghei]SCN24164.1 60S ribosomal protein L7ae/L30e, putative [Plasmodium berghei]SCO59427.1 60S ribosomal protein L7ae/L30e, putative [Plasmodium berghei]SCO60664.1 60S ribosomal protein L7ae/L30e, putative [Plasmodium berghei]|eukprot:XP_034420963.1 60S ribosomal protein L7ae/L30e, putative [Plasmodium berghei ANKA]
MEINSVKDDSSELKREKEKEKGEEQEQTENEQENDNNSVISTNKNKEKKGYDKAIEEIKKENSNSYISKISEPLLKKKYYKYLLKIIDYTYHAKINATHIIKTNEQLDDKKKKILKTKFLIIGLSQVIKAIRRGIKGILILAIDVFPIDIICHMPIFCEENNIPYTFFTTKNKLAHLCKLKRSITCLFICKPNNNLTEFENTLSKYNSKHKISNYNKAYDKLQIAIKKNHPFFQ